MRYTYNMKKFKRTKLDKPILQYESLLEEYPNIVSPAKANIPEWYKKIPKWKDNEIFSKNNTFNSTVKQCMPFLETLTAGYVVKLPIDLYVKNHDGIPFLAWKGGDLDRYTPSWREGISDSSIVPPECFPLEYTWKFNCSFKVPEQYSMLITHPLNRNDLPFRTVSGIVDGNFALQPDGNLPFYIKRNFEGIIPQGTPIAQVIPFYNQDWVLESKEGLLKESIQNKKKSNSVFIGFYKKYFWQKKDYN